MSKLRLAVVSDIHAASAAHKHCSGSNVIVPVPSGRASPIEDLKTLIRNQSLRADYLMCPGDIANQADSAAFAWMWSELKSIGTELGVREVVATCGNHDLDSRYLMEQDDATVDTDPDARGAILSLRSRFPELTEEEHSFYWAQNFVILERNRPGPHRILLINTCAYHGSNLKEIEHGRISQRTIDRITSALATRPRCGLNMLLCHHHLVPMASWNTQPDYQYVKKGGDLMSALELLALGPWLVIHGHRHWPECFYLGGGAGSPVVFAAGSFGKAAAQVTNQFHLLEVELSAMASRPLGLINTWFWTLSGTWKPSMSGDRALSYQSGFGFTGSINQLAFELSTLIPAKGSYIEWSALVGKKPQLQNLLPKDFTLLLDELRRTYNARVHIEDGVPIQISLR